MAVGAGNTLCRTCPTRAQALTFRETVLELDSAKRLSELEAVLKARAATDGASTRWVLNGVVSDLVGDNVTDQYLKPPPGQLARRQLLKSDLHVPRRPRTRFQEARVAGGGGCAALSEALRRTLRQFYLPHVLKTP